MKAQSRNTLVSHVARSLFSVAFISSLAVLPACKKEEASKSDAAGKKEVKKDAAKESQKDEKKAEAPAEAKKDAAKPDENVVLAATTGTAGVKPFDELAGKPNAKISGIYDESLLVAVDNETHILTGSFFEQRGDQKTGPTFTCSYLIFGAGRAGSDQYSVFVFNLGDKEAIHGTADFKKGADGKSQFVMKLSRAPDGCSNVVAYDFTSGTESMFLSKPASFSEVMVVRPTVKRAYFYDAPNETTQRKAYVIGKDVVAVVGQEENDFIPVAYNIGSDKPVKGFIKAADLGHMNEFNPDHPEP